MLALAAACGAPPAQVPTAPAPTPIPTPPPPKPVIVSVDGLRPDAIGKAGAAHMLGLAARGAFGWTARTVSPSVTLNSHGSMLTGVAPSEHALSWNEYEPATLPRPRPAMKAATMIVTE
jgi:predicted AlkP superfamily pyrophosphatase or phosphodiesterase